MPLLLFAPNRFQFAIEECRIKCDASGMELFHHRHVELLLCDQDFDVSAALRGGYCGIEQRLSKEAPDESEPFRSAFPCP